MGARTLKSRVLEDVHEHDVAAVECAEAAILVQTAIHGDTLQLVAISSRAGSRMLTGHDASIARYGVDCSLFWAEEVASTWESRLAWEPPEVGLLEQVLA